MSVQIKADFGAVDARLAEIASRTAAALEAALTASSQAVGNVAVQAIKAHTPVVTGKLRDSTIAVIDGTGTSRVITISQPATSSEGVHYVQYVINGRGPVYPVNKKALFWHGLQHPVAHSGPAKGNPYVERSLTEARSLFATAINDATKEALKATL